MAANLFSNRGGRASKAMHVPSDSESLALTTALVMYWTWRTDNTHPSFYLKVASEVRACKGSSQMWTKDEIKAHVQEKLYKKIPGDQVSIYYQRYLHGTSGEERTTARADLVSVAMYLYITHMSESGG